MNDRAVSLLDQYELEVTHTRKGRGAILCETDRGLLIFKEYAGDPEHLKYQDEFLKLIFETGQVAAERLISTKEGEFYVRDGDGTCYLLKTYLDGRECNIREKEECLMAVNLLARLHVCAVDGAAWSDLPAYSMAREYAKRNRELKKIRKFLKGRGQKTWFELSLQGCFDAFYEQAVEAQEGWESYRQNFAGDLISSFCHGDYQYHNILMDSKGMFLINFERCIKDDPVRDLHLLLRKLLEKSDWSISLGEELLREYEKIRPLPIVSKIDLHYRLAYPEKFWKIANFYYNSGKAWIPGRNLEKLEKLIAQEEKKKAFLESTLWLS